MAGNITSEAKVQTMDDGVSQDVTVKKGIQKEGWEMVPNPVSLAPYRTFSEVDQPESNFVLRVKANGPTCALYEADGGAWKAAAMHNIAAYLAYRLNDKKAAGTLDITILE